MYVAFFVTYSSLLSFMILHSMACQLHRLAPIQLSSSLHTRNPQFPSHVKDPRASPIGLELQIRQTGCETVKGPTTKG